MKADCVWKETKKPGVFVCPNCKIPSAAYKLYLDGLPPKRNCTNPKRLFLLGDFLERTAKRLIPDPTQRNEIGKRIDRVFGMEKSNTCHCAYRQKVLNDWTREWYSKPWYRRPVFLAKSLAKVARSLHWPHVVKIRPSRG